MRRLAVLAAFVVGIMLPATPAQADTFSAWSDGIMMASAEFAIVGDNLQITLTNTSPFDVTSPTQVLTAFFFDLDLEGALTPESAMLADKSTILFGPAGNKRWRRVGLFVRAGWRTTWSRRGNQQHWIRNRHVRSSCNFNGPTLEDPDAVNGLDYGLTSAGDDKYTGNNAVTAAKTTLSGIQSFLH